MAANNTTICAKLRKAAEASGMTQQQIGEAMGFAASGARQAGSRLLNPEVDIDEVLGETATF